MKWTFNNDRPIYAQLTRQIELGIVSGEFPPGSNLPSVRVLAVEAEVNPNTMQKALSELEARGLLYTQRTAGRYVTEDGKMIETLKEDLARDHIAAFLQGMQELGIDREEAVRLIKTVAAENYVTPADTAATAITADIKEVN